MFRIKRLCVIGVGLIGGSLARALKEARVVRHVVGCGRTRSELEKAVRLGVIDEFTSDPAVAVKDADMVVVAVPLGSSAAIFRKIAAHLSADAIITDVGSAKACVVEAARQTLGSASPRFVPGHPIAGTEQNGVDASFASLFEEHRVILTPVDETRIDATTRVREMWEHCGAQVEMMDMHHHDEVLAATSHLPHLLAYSLVGSLATMNESREIFRFAAGGFADFTRIASSSPVMWHDIIFNNKDAILQVMETFSGDLDKLKQAIENEDREQILACFSRAKQARDEFTVKHKKKSLINNSE